MCTNGSRVARSTPAKARRTGKPSPSRPEGAVVSDTTGRSAAGGVHGGDAWQDHGVGADGWHDRSLLPDRAKCPVIPRKEVAHETFLESRAAYIIRPHPRRSVA